MSDADSEWFESWFGEEYVALYPHRDEAEAERAVELISERVGGRKVRRALDLACGAGRHSRALTAQWWTAGLDLSEVLLRHARREEIAAPLVRADMRVLPFGDGAFDLVVNLFTSFGYFEHDSEHVEVIAEVARVTSGGGTFVMDFLNATNVRETIIPYDEQVIGNTTVEQRRSITSDGRYVVKHIAIRGQDKTFVERVRLFKPAELAAMMTRAGFTITAEYGNYDCAPLTEHSPRTILFGARA